MLHRTFNPIDKYKIDRFKLRISDALDLWVSRFLDIHSVKSVCLALGPYRNLTTLTASILFLHENCQVLNHAGMRIYENSKLNFFINYDKKKIDRFIKFAIKISEKGQRGDIGGSITFSHAFDSHHKMNAIFHQAGLDIIKKQINCLFWKESLRTSILIRREQIDLAGIIAKEDRLRFLLPIRNPLDCAKSNLNTGHVAIFPGLNKGTSIYEVVKAIIDEFIWFADLNQKFPSRFFYFFEHELSRTTLIDLAKFLELDMHDAWISNALSAIDIKSTYIHDTALINFYKDYIERRLVAYPELLKGLLAFC